MLNFKKTIIDSVVLFLTVSAVGCGKSEKTGIDTNKTVVVQSTDNELTSSLKNEVVSSNDGQKFYDIGVCMGLASLVYNEEVHKNDDEKKSLIGSGFVQLNKSVDLVSINKHVTLISTQKCGDHESQSNENYNQCAERNFSHGLKGWIKGVAAPRHFISNGQLGYEGIFDQFNIYCKRFLKDDQALNLSADNSSSKPEISATADLKSINNTSFSKFKGAWFEVYFPSRFTVKSIEGKNNLVNGVMFTSENKKVQFQLFSPQWKDGSSIDTVDNNSEKEVSREKKISTQDGVKGNLIFITIQSNDKSYLRSYQVFESDDGSIRNVIGIKYANQADYSENKEAYLNFKKSWRRFSN